VAREASVLHVDGPRTVPPDTADDATLAAVLAYETVVLPTEVTV
jgi:hypothetical protein